MNKQTGAVAVAAGCLLGGLAGQAHATLLAHYEFDEASGTTVSDSAGSNDGTAI